MYFKLALRNVKRQLGNYIVYFITVSLTISLMFALNNLIYSDAMVELSQDMPDMKSSLITLTIVIAVIVSLILGYATSFMLKLRKREFATYMTLGMNRKNILRLFSVETTVIGVIALVVGVAFGLLLFQVVMGLLARLMDVTMSISSYSLDALILTVGVVALMFILSSIASGIYLRKVSIRELFAGQKNSSRTIKHPYIWFFVTLLSLALLVFSVIKAYQCMKLMIILNQPIGSTLLYLLLIVVAMLAFHIGLSKSLVNLMLKNKKACAKGTNTFVLRQLSSKLEINSVLAGFLALLMSASVICFNMSLMQQVSELAQLDLEYPFDVTAEHYIESPSPITFEEGNAKIQDYVQIENRINYDIFTSGKNDIYSHTMWADQYGLNDAFIKESDYNKLAKAMGSPQVHLNHEFAIYANDKGVEQYNFSGINLRLNDAKYSFDKMITGSPRLTYLYCLIIIEDAAVEGMKLESQFEALDLADSKFDSSALYNELTYIDDQGEYDEKVSNFDIKDYYVTQTRNQDALFVIGEMYISVVFILLGMAILALKVLSGILDDRRNMRTLYRLGASEKMQGKALFRQTFVFFFIPFIIPILTTIPATIICNNITKLLGFPGLISQITTNGITIAVIISVIYVLYFIATFLICKRNSVCYERI